MIFGRLADPGEVRDRDRSVSPCAEPGSDELLLDWGRDEAYALDWARHEGELWWDWQRLNPGGPRWGTIADYHRYGWAARQKHPDLTWEEVRCGFWRAFAAGKWDTPDPWGQIEYAMRRGWERVDIAALSPDRQR